MGQRHFANATHRPYSFREAESFSERLEIPSSADPASKGEKKSTWGGRGDGTIEGTTVISGEGVGGTRTLPGIHLFVDLSLLGLVG